MCDVPTGAGDVATLISFVNGCLGSEAMVNYPYPTDFIANLPAWPVTESCNAALAVNPSSDESYVIAL